MTAPKFSVVLAAIAAAASFSAPAFAQDEFIPNGHSIAVGYGDLDLSKPRDVRTLDRRLFRAAWKVCPGETLGERTACQKLALAHARQPFVELMAKARANGAYAKADPDSKIAIIN